MMRLIFVSPICCFLSLVSALTAAERPNVLLICVDDLKPTLGCYGDSTAITPHIDRLAERGVRFDYAYCNQAVCSPSRNSLMTGLRPTTIGIYDLPTHFRKAVPDAVTMTQHFKQAGYHAEGIGKIYHVGHGNINDAASWSKPWSTPNASSYVAPESLKRIVPDKKGRKRGPATESADVNDETYKDGKIAQATIKRLKDLSQREQPFFLAVGFMKPHLPFVAPQKYWDLYDPAELPMPEVLKKPAGAPSYVTSTGGELRNYSDMRGDWPPNKKVTRHLIHGYYAATSYMDAQLGKVTTALKELGLDSNTIVVLWGDHGWHLGDHQMWCKHTNYEQAARIPLIVAAPGHARGAATDALVETVDIYPTLAELGGLDAPDKLDGISFANVVADPSQAARPYVNHVYPKGGRLGRAIRDHRYRMVEWKVPGQSQSTAEYELYDYQDDPLETVNIADKKIDVLSRMNSLLAEQPEAKKQWKPKQK